ncbi:extracellular solute-binding protein [Cohnella abietis]|uniref:extracellular solute-binding protein n=1 Tax=Cohnella abietis TaxID=2507935 RepID=UPI00139065A1|nr:extracellular solute-binding protein [Cohnella abietis]
MWKKSLAVPLVAALFVTGCSSATSNEENTTATSDKPATWIADRTIKGLIFQDAGDISTYMNPEIAKVLKEKTGITLEIQGVTSEDSTQALAAGLAAGDLPDFIGFYLNNSGRPEMPILLKAAKEGMFADLTSSLKNTSIYSKYFQDGYLPTDAKTNIMFRPDFNGATYLVYTAISRNTGQIGKKYVGGPFVRKDIMDQLGIDPSTINTTEQVYDLAKKMKDGHFKDAHGKDIYPIGPTVWGGKDVNSLFNDLVWTGPTEEKFMKDEAGKIKFESQTDYGLERIAFIQKLLKEKLIHPEFFTMEENRSKEALINHSFGIVAEMHNYIPENNNMTYVPLGPINYVNGPYQMQVDYKSGGGGWSIPATTKNPEDIVKLADFLASREGKLLAQYGIEGRDYTLDAKGNPIAKQEVLDLKASNPAEAAKLGFRGVGNWWGEYLGYTDLDPKGDFGEDAYGDAASADTNKTPNEIIKLWDYDGKLKAAKIVDGLTPLSFIYDFDQGADLRQAIDNYNESLLRAYYSSDMQKARKIMDEAAARLDKYGLKEYVQFLENKESAEKVSIKF